MGVGRFLAAFPFQRINGTGIWLPTFNIKNQLNERKCTIHSLSQWLNFKLSRITCLVGKIKFKLLSQGPKWLSEYYMDPMGLGVLAYFFLQQMSSDQNPG